MNLFRFILAMAALSFSCNATTYAARTWKDSNGSYSVEAEFIELQRDGTVLLRRADNQEVIAIGIEKLSKVDQAFLKNQEPSDQQLLTAAELEREAQKQATANDVVKLYESSLALGFIGIGDIAEVRANLEEWKTLESQKAVRVGKVWKPLSDAEAIEKSANLMEDEGIRFFSAGRFKEGIDKLEKASKINPEGIQADFWLGMSYAIVGKNADEAKAHFMKCVTRRDGRAHRTNAEERNYTIALNNLALAQMRCGEDAVAFRSWAKAFEAKSPTPEMIHNLGQFGRLASSTSFVKLSSGLRSEASQLYKSATAATSDVDQINESAGWLYIMLVREPTFREKVEGNISDSMSMMAIPSSLATERQILLCGSGTGIVIDGNYIITNRSVVEGGAYFEVTLGPLSTAPATLVAVSKDEDIDLAILECLRITAAPLSFSDAPLQQGKEFAAMGYRDGISPEQDQAGMTLSQGILSVLPSDSTPYSSIVFDAKIDKGSSGGPVCDRSGNVVAVATFSHSFDVCDKYGGVPCSDVIAFAKEHNIDLRMGSNATNEKEDWSNIASDLQSAILPVHAYREQSHQMYLGQLSKPFKQSLTASHVSTSFHEKSCINCYGIGRVPCVGRGCVGGRISHKTQEIYAYDNRGNPIYRPLTVYTSCTVCGGKNSLPCPTCRGRGY